MKVTASLRKPVLDLSGYKKALEKHMTEALAQGLMEWLEAVLAEIPVWSGAARATFVKLAQHIQYQIPILPEVFDRTGRGMSASTGEMTRDIERGQFTFKYSTYLPWLVWNEYHNANVDPDPTKWPPPAKLKRPGPYDFQTKGAEAFQKFADQVKLPAVIPYVRSQSVRA